MYAYAAFYGEYDESYPIGIYNTLAKAKQALIDSNPTYNTEVIKYNLTDGTAVTTYYYSVRNKTFTQRTP